MLIVRGMTETCFGSPYGQHDWTGHGDPYYMWCGNCQQEKPTNREFIAWDTRLQARTVVEAKCVSRYLSIFQGERVHEVIRRA